MTTKVEKSFEIGELLSMEWVFGVSVAQGSSTAQGTTPINTPYVQLLLKIKDPDQKISEHKVEMEMGDFQEMASKWKDCAQALENML